MATGLRAFLMTRRDAEWSISVHRDLEELLGAWKDRQSPEEMVGVLHLGFDRPPAREFDTIAEQWPGHMLVTASAKFGLPVGFVASDGEIGRVSDLPVYLGVRGWGYTVDEALIPKVKKTEAVSPARPPAGWVRRLLDQHPEAAPDFEKCGIFDENSYVAAESGLPTTLRRAAGAYRFDEMIAGDPNDPCAFARAAPPWLSEQDFQTMPVTVRVANVFTKLDIRTVSDLEKHSLNELLDTQNFGKKSAADLLRCLRTALDDGPIEKNPIESEAVHSTLIECIDASLSKYPERARDIMFKRMGLGQRPATLQDLGDQHGVTRERVRQIEAAVTKRLIREEIWDDLLTEKLASLMENRRIPLPIKGIEAVDGWFAGMGQQGEALAYLLANVSTGPAKLLEIDGTDYIGLLTQEEWNEALSGARGLLENGADRGWTVEHCRSVVQAMLPGRCKEFRDLLWDHASRHAQFVDRDGVAVLVAFGRSVENLVHAVLAASERPLHYSEIATLAAERSGREVDIRRVHNAAANIGYLFSRGTYGLDRHVPLSKEVMVQVADEAEQMVVEGAPGRQWHTAEIAAELIERRFQHASALDKHLIDIALKRSGNLEQLGRLVWSGSSSDQAAYRVDLRQAIIATLQEAGTPLRTEEIRQRIESMRGLGEHFQIAPVDPIMRIEPGVWGLNDRDLSIKRPDQPRFLDALVEILRKRGTGLHSSEIEQSPFLKSRGLNATALCSLATTDPRLKVSPSRYLFLQEWGAPRRESLAEAVSAVMDAAERPLALGEIVDRVKARLDRSCEGAAISGSLQAIDAVYDPSSATWSRGANAEAEMEVAVE